MCVDVCGLFLLTFTTSEMTQCCNLNTFKVSVGKEGVVKWEVGQDSGCTFTSGVTSLRG